jgi:hypothetical protein
MCRSLQPRARAGEFIGADGDCGSSGWGAESGELEPSVILTRLRSSSDSLESLRLLVEALLDLSRVISSGVKTGCVKLESQVWGDRNKVVDGVQETPSFSMDRGKMSIIFYIRYDVKVNAW